MLYFSLFTLYITYTVVLLDILKIFKLYGVILLLIYIAHTSPYPENIIMLSGVYSSLFTFYITYFSVSWKYYHAIRCHTPPYSHSESHTSQYPENIIMLSGVILLLGHIVYHILLSILKLLSCYQVLTLWPAAEKRRPHHCIGLRRPRETKIVKGMYALCRNALVPAYEVCVCEWRGASCT